MKEFAQYIAQLLFYHDYVIIPGFGGFIAQPKSASVHPTQHTMTPPSKTIAFNRRLKDDDGLLINYIAQQEDIEKTEAQEKVDQFTQTLKDRLEEKERVTLPQIGKLYFNAEGKLQFTPNRSVNYDLDAYGLPEIQFYPIQRRQKKRKKRSKTSTSRKTKQTSTSTKETQTASPSRFPTKTLAAVALILAVLAGIQLFYFDGYQRVGEHLKTVTSSLFPGTDTAHDKISPIDTPAQQTPVKSDTTHPVTDTSSTESVTTQDTSRHQQPTKTLSTPSTKQYYVIVGSFQNEQNAHAYKSQLETSESSVRILKHPDKGYHRVAIGQHKNSDQALAHLQKARQQYNSSAWLYEEES